jgi:integrase
LRHGFEDRLLAAGVDERIRRDLLGHALKRERYGSGATLEHMQELVLKVAL